MSFKISANLRNNSVCFCVKPIHIDMECSEITKVYIHEWNRCSHAGFALTCLKGLLFEFDFEKNRTCRKLLRN